jgi:6-phosphofructokinase 2
MPARKRWRKAARMRPSFVTLTLNPTVDVACNAGRVQTVHKVRTFAETYDPGGGGVNVARVLQELGADVQAVACCGGVSGHLLEELLAQAHVPCRAVRIADRTRICMTVQDIGAGQEYRFVPEGPLLSPPEWQAALAAAEDCNPDWLIASGSLPRGVPEDFYARLARTATARGQRVVLDTSGPALRAALGSGLALIKPSLGEFETLVGRALREPAAQEDAARELVRAGAAERVAVTLGRDGALLATGEGVWRRPALDVPVRGAVGAGDSFLAAMVLALARGEGPAEALTWGTAAGAAAVMNTGTAHPARGQIEALFRRMVAPSAANAAIPISEPRGD